MRRGFTKANGSGACRPDRAYLKEASEVDIWWTPEPCQYVCSRADRAAGPQERQWNCRCRIASAQIRQYGADFADTLHLLDEITMLRWVPQNFHHQRLFRHHETAPPVIMTPSIELVGARHWPLLQKAITRGRQQVSLGAACSALRCDGRTCSTPAVASLGAFRSVMPRSGSSLALTKDNKLSRFVVPTSASAIRPTEMPGRRDQSSSPSTVSHGRRIDGFAATRSRCPNVYNWRSKVPAEDADNNILGVCGFGRRSQRVLPGQCTAMAVSAGVIVSRRCSSWSVGINANRPRSGFWQDFSEKFFPSVRSIMSKEWRATTLKRNNWIGAYAIGHHFRPLLGRQQGVLGSRSALRWIWPQHPAVALSWWVRAACSGSSWCLSRTQRQRP